MYSLAGAGSAGYTGDIWDTFCWEWIAIKGLQQICSNHNNTIQYYTTLITEDWDHPNLQEAWQLTHRSKLSFFDQRVLTSEYTLSKHESSTSTGKDRIPPFDVHAVTSMQRWFAQVSVCSRVFFFVTLCVPVWSVFVPFCACVYVCAHNEETAVACCSVMSDRVGTCSWLEETWWQRSGSLMTNP